MTQRSSAAESGASVRSARSASTRLVHDVQYCTSDMFIFDLVSSRTNCIRPAHSLSKCACSSLPSLVRDASHDVMYGFQPRSASET